MNVPTGKEYGEQFADVYDEWYGVGRDHNAVARTLLELAGSGPLLELGVGTGLVALPIAAAAGEVHGIEISPKMLAKLREKPGADRIHLHVADFSVFELPQRFSMVFCVANTLFYLTTQDAQVQCFRTVAQHLQPGGCFVLEGFMPGKADIQAGGSCRVLGVNQSSASLELMDHDPIRQMLRTQTCTLHSGGTKLRPAICRYAWPSELDLMARLAGLTLRHRWGGWTKQPCDHSSSHHISVYIK